MIGCNSIGAHIGQSDACTIRVSPASAPRYENFLATFTVALEDQRPSFRFGRKVACRQACEQYEALALLTYQTSVLVGTAACPHRHQRPDDRVNQLIVACLARENKAGPSANSYLLPLRPELELPDEVVIVVHGGSACSLGAESVGSARYQRVSVELVLHREMSGYVK